MARQKGILKLKGTIGDITFYKTRDGYVAREKTSIDANRIANDPAFQRTRENGAEFGRAGKASKLLRNTLRPYFKNYADYRMTSRLTQAMMKVVQADLVSVRGMRNVIDGEAELLAGFEFNRKSQLSGSLFAPMTHIIDRAMGTVEFGLPAYVPEIMVGAPSGTTHYSIVSVAVAVNFETEDFEVSAEQTEVLPYNNVLGAPIQHSHSVSAGSTVPIFLCVGIEFFQRVNGEQYALRNGAYNPFSIVKVDGGV